MKEKMLMIVLTMALVAGSLVWVAGCQRPEADPGDRLAGDPNPAIPGDRYEPTEEEQAWIDDNTREPGVLLKKFGDHFILLVAMGEKPSGGYEVVIDEIATSGDDWVIDVRFAEPDPGSMVITVITYPYEIVKIVDTGLGVRVRDITKGEPEELEVTRE